MAGDTKTGTGNTGDPGSPVGNVSGSGSVGPGDPGNGNPVDDRSELERLKAHSREVLDEKKRIQKERDDLAAKLASLDETKKKEQGKFQELYEGEKVTRTKLEQDLAAERRRLTLLRAAVRNGFDPDYVDFIKGADFDEKGSLANEEDVFKGMRERYPKLFSEGATSPGSTAAPPRVDTSKAAFKPDHVFTKGEISRMDRETYDKNRDLILQQTRAGLIK